MDCFQLGLYEKSMPNSLSIPEKLLIAGETGFNYLEISIDETDEKLARLDWDPQMIRSLSVAQFDTGIPIKSMCLSGHRRYPLGHPDQKIQKTSLEIMEKAVVLAAKLGIRVIQIAGYDVYYQASTPETRQIFGENLRKSVEMAAREGVVLAFETMETEFINTVEKALSWVRQVDSPYLQIYPDIGNITNAALIYGTDVLADLRSGKGHLVALHLKETIPGIYREVPYGTGHVNFETAIEVAFKLGVRLFVGEFWHTGEKNWRETVAANREFLYRNLKKADMAF